MKSSKKAALTLVVVADDSPGIHSDRLRELSQASVARRIVVTMIEPESSDPFAVQAEALATATTPYVMVTDASTLSLLELELERDVERGIERGDLLADRLGLDDAPFPLLAPSGWREREMTAAFRAWIDEHHPDYAAAHARDLDEYVHQLPFRGTASSLHGLDVVDGGTVLRLTGTCRRAANDEEAAPEQRVRLVLMDEVGDDIIVLDTEPRQRMEAGRERWSGFVAELPVDQLPLGKSTLDIELGASGGFEPTRVPVRVSVGALAASRPIATAGRRFQAFPVHGSERIELVTLRDSGVVSRWKWNLTAVRRDLGSMARRRPFAWTRVARLLTRPFYLGRTIWLVGERPDTARDNGFHLFKHLSSERRDIKAYYVIEKSAPQFGQMKRIGRVIKHSSWRHRLLMLHTTALVNAYSIKHMVPRQWDPGLYMRQFTWRIGSYRIYLKHGVHMNTKVIKRRVSGYDLMLTATPGETAGARETSGYDRQIAQTGLPRYDALVPTPPSRTILFMPTWRLYFAPRLFSEETEAPVPFAGSAYQAFMRDFLTSERLRDLLAKHDFRLQFMPHYNMRDYLADLPIASDRITFLDGAAADIQDVMRGCDLFLTDHSSVHFDIAYLGTPLVYAHFDNDDYRSMHALASWFEHERDGFGPVTYDLGSTLDAIERYLDAGCVREELYDRRAQAAFTYHDRHNSQRAVAAIEELLDTQGIS